MKHIIFPYLTTVALLACCCSQVQHVGCADEKGSRSGGFVEELPPDMVALVKQQQADERRITIREANLFHRHFIDTCMQVVPQNLTLGYCGLLAIDDGRHTPRLHGTEFTMEDVVVIGEETAGPTVDVVPTTDPGGFIPYEEVCPLGEPLHWVVGNEDMISVFGFWISTQPTKQTVAKCNLEGRVLFVNVDFVTRDQSVDTKLPELGGRSVREVLKHIEKPGPKPGLPERFKPLLRSRIRTSTATPRASCGTTGTTKATPTPSSQAT